MNSYLEIDGTTLDAIAGAIADAAANVTPYDAFVRETTLMRYFRTAMARPAIPVIVIPVGHGAALRLVEIEPGRPFRHLCLVSPGDGPDPVHVAIIAGAFGFQRPLAHCTAWRSVLPGGRSALNLLEPCDDREWYDAPGPLPAATQRDLP